MSKRDKIVNIVFLQSIYLYYSLLGVLSKRVSGAKLFTVEFFIGYGIVLFAIFLFAVMWQQVIKRNSLFVAYANKGTVILWTLLWAVLLYHEKIRVNNLIGAVAIIGGIIVVSKDE